MDYSLVIGSNQHMFSLFSGQIWKWDCRLFSFGSYWLLHLLSHDVAFSLVSLALQTVIHTPLSSWSHTYLLDFSPMRHASHVQYHPLLCTYIKTCFLHLHMRFWMFLMVLSVESPHSAASLILPGCSVFDLRKGCTCQGEASRIYSFNYGYTADRISLCRR